ncbi:putative importin beta-1 subunit [Trypanosoma vivax]|nr:putative importin beta-1 subunit [Trypanosoma vivax]
MSGLSELMLALCSSDASIRIPAEQQVEQARQADLGGFLCALLEEFRDESKPSLARYMAGSLLKNSVAPNLRDASARRELELKWMALPPHLRFNVKQIVLSTLGSPKKEVQNVAANIVGNLSRIELPAGEWPDLMNILIGAAESGSEEHQEAALTAIGYVCEEGRDHEAVEKALVPYTNGILNAVVRGMNSGREEVRYYATNALCNAMEFIHDNMNQQQQRDLLIDALCITAKGSQNARTREKAMESLVKVADMYYSTLPNYIDRLHAITTSAIFEDEESVALQAMLFWTSICETEIDMKEEQDSRCVDYAMKGASMLVDICLKALVRQEEDQEEGDWNISIAGGKLLQSVALCIGNPIIDLVMPFIYSKIESSDWREKEAAAMAFGCILNGPDPVVIRDTVAQAVPGLLQYIRHEHRLVADTAGWVLSVVCSNFADVFLYCPPNLQQLMNIVTGILASEGTLAIRGCHIIHNLALTFSEETNQPTNELSPYLGDLLGVFLRIIDSGVDHNLRNVAQETLSALVDAAAVDCYQLLDRLAPELHKRMVYVLNARHHGQMGAIESIEMLGLLCGSLGSVAKTLQHLFVPHLAESMRIMLQILEIQKDTVLDECLVMLSAFAYGVKKELLPYIEAVIPYVVKALQCVNEIELATVAVCAVGDLALNVGTAFSHYTVAILDVLHSNLVNPAVDRTLKCTFINCLADIAVNTDDTYFGQYRDTFMQIVQLMFDQSRALNIEDNPSDEEFVMTLWESTGTFYSSVCQSMKESEDRLSPHLQNILNFTLHSATVAHSRGYMEVFTSVVTVIGDMSSVLTTAASKELVQQAKNALLTPQVWHIVELAMKCCEGNTEEALWTKKKLEALRAA